MFTPARKAAQAKTSSGESNLQKTPPLSADCLPARYTLTQIYDELVPVDGSPSKDDALQTLLILEHCLSHSDRLQRETGDDKYIDKLSLWISQIILPDGSLNVEDDIPTASQENALLLIHQKSTLGLSIQTLIANLSSPGLKTLDPKILISFIAYSSPDDPWTTSTTVTLSKYLLNIYTSQTHSQDFIITMLNTFIRPLFSHSKPSTITSTGRKAMPSSAPLPRYDAAAEKTSKPWKYEAVYAVRVFAWAVENAAGEIIVQNWPLFTPPLLTLLDESSTPLRVTGTKVLATFLPHLSSKLLQQSGIGEVFEDALMPTLLYLPNLTPVEESLVLLPAAYKTLCVLCDARFPGNENVKERVDALDRMMRQGVLMGYNHASEYPAIMQVLLEQMKVLVEKMGIHAVKHLKDTNPIISTTITDPFASSRPSLLIAGAQALQTVILNCWPRIGIDKYRMEIIKALCICWKDVSDAGGAERLEDVKVELMVAGKLFVSALEGEMDIRGELRMLVDVDGRMGMLFGLES